MPCYKMTVIRTHNSHDKITNTWRLMANGVDFPFDGVG